MTTTPQRESLDALGSYKFGWSDSDAAGAIAKRGLSEEVVRNISALKSEPAWMLETRLKALKLFRRKPMPAWGADLSGIDFDNIKYFVRSTEKQADSWDDLPADIKNTYDKLGIPEAEKQRLISGVAAQYECLAGGSRVWTADRGQVPIKEIRTGDVVFALDEASGRFVLAPVRAMAQTGVRQTYRVRAGGREIFATDNHPFLTIVDLQRDARPTWTALSDIAVGDLICLPTGLPDFGTSHAFSPVTELPHSHAFGPALTSPDLLWLIGLFVAAGELDAPAGTVTLRWVDDGSHGATDRVMRVLHEQFDVAPVVGAPVRVHSCELVEWLQNIGAAAGSSAKAIPGWVSSLPRAERLAFVDGWGQAYSGDLESRRLTGLNESLLSEALEIAELCGLRALGPITKSEAPHAQYSVGLMGGFPQLPGVDASHVDYRHVVEIEPHSIEPVYDVEVDGPHNFIAEGLVVHNSEVVYHKIREDLEEQGVLFLDTDSGLREHEDLFREYFGSVIPPGDNKFAALNTATWSGGSFIYVPKGVVVEIPLQAYFRINTENMGQFERTLIIADEGSSVHYVEGCLPAGELVARADGQFVPIESLQVGDHVLTSEGRSERVNATQVRDHTGTLHKIVPVSPANAFEVTDEHPVLLVRRGDVATKRAPRNGWLPEVDSARLRAAAPQWVPAKDVAAGDFIVFPKPHFAPPKVVLPIELARLAGYFIAEGRATLTNGCESLVFSFHIDEVDYVREVQDLCKELWDVSGSVRYDEAKHEARVLLYTKAGYHAMIDHVGNGSAHKRLSADFIAQDDEFLRNLVETYICGDGNVNKRAGGQSTWVRAHTTSKGWALQLQAIQARFGLFATVERRRPGGPAEILGRQVVRQDLWQVQWTEGGRGPRLVRDAGDYFLVPVRSHERREHSGLVYNLDVNAPDSYLASGFAVHNCTAPVYSSDSLHSAVVEIVVKKNAHVRYTTIQNWSNNVYNLVTKRTSVAAGGRMEWIDGNLGSKVTMKYPACYLLGEHAYGETLSVAFAGPGQHQDAGAKMVHAAPNTSSQIVSKSVARGGGRTSYRGLVQIQDGATNAKATVKCDALLVDQISRSDTYPYVDVREDDASIGHEATVSKIGADALFYLMSRGVPEDDAMAMIVRGFVEPIARELPMEYALELNRLIELQMEGSVG